MIMKVAGCLLVITSTSGMGLFFSSEIKSRLNDLIELKKMIILLRGDIRYAGTPLPEAISSIARRNNGNFKNFFYEISNKLSELSGITFLDVWTQSVNENLLDTSLQKEDKANLIRFGEGLGYLDKNMQINTIDLYIEQLEDEIEELTISIKQKTYLYNSLGIMSGIFISIIMI